MQELKPQEKYTETAENGIVLQIENTSQIGYIVPVEDIKEALTTMRYLVNNYEVLENEDIKVYETDIHNIRAILCDPSQAVDEFLIVDTNNNSISVEVVTADVAERNDRDFLRGNEQQEDYELGGAWSYYIPLNGTGYYYRLL